MVPRYRGQGPFNRADGSIFEGELRDVQFNGAVFERQDVWQAGLGDKLFKRQPGAMIVE